MMMGLFIDGPAAGRQERTIPDYPYWQTVVDNGNGTWTEVFYHRLSQLGCVTLYSVETKSELVEQRLLHLLRLGLKAEKEISNG